MTPARSFWNGPLSDDTHVTMNKRSTVSHGTKPKKNGKALRSATAGRGIGVLEIQKRAHKSQNGTDKLNV